MENRTPLIDLGRAIARGWWLIVVVVAVCTLAAIGVRLVSTTEYQSTATLTVSSTSADGSVNMDTEKVVATSTAVLTDAQKKLPSTSLRTLRSEITVTVPRNSDALQITATADSARGSAKIANAVASAYRSNRADSAKVISQAAVDDLTSRIAELRARINREPLGSDTSRALRQQVNLLEVQAATLTARSIYPGALVTKATKPTSPSTPSYLVFGGAGFLFGVIMAFFLALILDRVRGELAAREAAKEQPWPSVTAAAMPPPVPMSFRQARPLTRPAATDDAQ